MLLESGLLSRRVIIRMVSAQPGHRRPHVAGRRTCPISDD